MNTFSIVRDALKATENDPSKEGLDAATVEAGRVIDSPSAGDSVARGTAVPITVSNGPPMVAVPPVTGLSLADAAAKLQAAGLTVSGTQGSPLGRVQGTNPASGTVVRRGTAVVIITG